MSDFSELLSFPSLLLLSSILSIDLLSIYVTSAEKWIMGFIGDEYFNVEINELVEFSYCIQFDEQVAFLLSNSSILFWNVSFFK